MANCPHCNNVVLSATLQALPIQAVTGERWVGVSYSCPSCQKVLSVGIDPVALKTDTANEILEALGRGR